MVVQAIPRDVESQKEHLCENRMGIPNEGYGFPNNGIGAFVPPSLGKRIPE
jgi:uncharacterized protein (DUF2141 family)